LEARRYLYVYHQPLHENDTVAEQYLVQLDDAKEILGVVQVAPFQLMLLCEQSICMVHLPFH